MLQIVQTYLTWLRMVVKAGGYYPPPPFPGIPWGNPRQYFVPRGIQCGGGCCDMTPGDGGGANVSGIGGIQIDYSEIGGIFLCG